MKPYYIDLRKYSRSEHDHIKKLADDFAWDVYPMANLPNVYEIIWDSAESINEVLKIPDELISEYPPHSM